MSSRDKILKAVGLNQPASVALPDISTFQQPAAGSLEKFADVLTSIGGRVSYMSGYQEIASLVLNWHGSANRIVSTIPELKGVYESIDLVLNNPHNLQDVEVAIIKGHFAVAENGAIWVTEDQLAERALPFICQHLIIVIDAGAITPTMHDAYERIGKTSYSYGTFIAGPSKTADIEQSLVIGAHGARSMTALILGRW